MKTSRSIVAFVLALTALLPARAAGPLEDPLLERFVGTWAGQGVAVGPAGEELPYEDRLQVAWSVAHTWLAMDLSVSRGAPGGAGAYEARGFLTRTPGAGARYEFVWLDPDRRATVARGEAAPDALVLRAQDSAGGLVVTTYRFVSADQVDMSLELEIEQERLPLLRVTYRRL
jgi:hypothetical protein